MSASKFCANFADILCVEDLPRWESVCRTRRVKVLVLLSVVLLLFHMVISPETDVFAGELSPRPWAIIGEL
jgi:hypothetical protein